MGNCQSCGMPMTKPDDYGGGQTANPYCKYCTDDQGKLLSKDEVREKMIQFQMQNLNKTQEQAEIDVDKHMALMPAWKIGGPAVTPSSPPKVIVADEPVMPPKPSVSQPSVSGLGVPSPVAKPTPKQEPSDIGAPKPSGITPGGSVSDEPPAEPEAPPIEPAEPLVSESKPEPPKPEEPSTKPLVDLTEEPAAEPTEPEEETSPGME